MKRFETKYGELDLKVFSLSNAPVYATLEKVKLPAGLKLRGGQTLKKALTIWAGAVLMPRRNKDYPGGWCWQIFSRGLYEAWRACLHIRQGYEEPANGQGELIFLEEAGRDFAGLVFQLLRYRQLDQSEFAEVVDWIEQYRRSLRPAVNDLKAAAGGFVQGATGVMDCCGRLNPSATLTRVQAAKRRLVLRQEQIKRISPLIGRRQIALILAKDEIHRQLIEIYWKLEKIRQELASREQFQPEEPVCIGWRKQLLICLSLLKDIRIMPYAAWARRVMKELGAVRTFLEKSGTKVQVGQAERQIKKVCWAFRFKRARWELENLLWDFDFVFEHPVQAAIEDKDGLVNNLDFFLKRLNLLDDGLFYFPVKDRVATTVAEAINLVKEEKLAVAKNRLKQAAHRL